MYCPIGDGLSQRCESAWLSDIALVIKDTQRILYMWPVYDENFFDFMYLFSLQYKRIKGWMLVIIVGFLLCFVWNGSRQIVEIIWPFQFYLCGVFQITGTSTRPFQLTVEKLEKALQDAQAEVSTDELHITGQSYSMSEMAGPRCDLKSKTFSKPSTWLSHGPYRQPEVGLLANPAALVVEYSAAIPGGVPLYHACLGIH